jgi:hypothetical protein
MQVWDVAIAVGTILAAYFAYKAINQSNKQLEVEQEPYVVVNSSINLISNGRHMITLKNVGRGSALRITCSVDKEDKDKPFFETTESHSYNLSMNDHITAQANDSVIDKIKQNIVNNKDGFYIFYKSQLGKAYITKVKLKEIPNKLVFMENDRIEIGDTE